MADEPKGSDPDVLARLGSIESRLTRLESALSSMGAPRQAPAHAPAHAHVKPSMPTPPPPVAVVRPHPAPPLPPPHAPRGLQSAEQFVGTRLIAWIGALALLAGSAFFLKLAFDRGWISPAVRVALGAIAGLGLLVGAEVVYRRNLRAFAAAIAGAGIAILTLTNWAARTFDFTSFGGGFALGCAITLGGFAWSAWRSLQATLVLAEIGGFLTPVLITQPVRGPLGLAIYLASLSAASAGVAAIRRWRAPSAIAFVGSLVLFGGWWLDRWNVVREQYLADSLTSVALIAAVFIADVGLRAMRGGVARKLEALMLAAAAVLSAQAAAALLLPQGRETLGGFLVALAAAHAVIAWRTASLGDLGRAAVRAIALAVAIAAVTGALPCFFERSALGVAWAAEAAALALLEARTRAAIPLLGATLVHGLVAARMFAFGEVPESTTFLWTERATVGVAEILSLIVTAKALAHAQGLRATLARVAFAASHFVVAYVLLETLPASRVTLAWAALSLALAYVAHTTRQPDATITGLVVAAATAVRFLYRDEIQLADDAWPFLNVRAATLVAFAAAAFVHGRVLRAFSAEWAPLRVVLYTLATGVAAMAAGSELAMAFSRAYGSHPPILEGLLSMGGAPYSPFWNARFAFLAAAAGCIALSVRPLRASAAPDAKAQAATHTLAAHGLVWLGLCLEAIGLASRAAGANPSSIAEDASWSSVQTALSIALAAYPALALTVGFRRGAIHRFFGLGGLLAAALKVTFVDLGRLPVEWRMISCLAIGVLLLAGAFFYARAARRSRAVS